MWRAHLPAPGASVKHTRHPVTGDYSSSIALFLRLPSSLYHHTHFDSLPLSSSHHIFVSCLSACLKHRRTLSYHPLGSNSHTCSPSSHSYLVETPHLPVTPERQVISALCSSTRPRTSRPHCSSPLPKIPIHIIHTQQSSTHIQRPISADPPAISPDRHHRHHPKHHLHPDDRHCHSRHVFFRPVFIYLRPSQRRSRPQTRRCP